MMNSNTGGQDKSDALQQDDTQDNKTKKADNPFEKTGPNIKQTKEEAELEQQRKEASSERD